VSAPAEQQAAPQAPQLLPAPARSPMTGGDENAPPPAPEKGPGVDAPKKVIQ
jgi:hypothetical protein